MFIDFSATISQVKIISIWLKRPGKIVISTLIRYLCLTVCLEFHVEKRELTKVRLEVIFRFGNLQELNSQAASAPCLGRVSGTCIDMPRWRIFKWHREWEGHCARSPPISIFDAMHTAPECLCSLVKLATDFRLYHLPVHRGFVLCHLLHLFYNAFLLPYA